ncbi:GNAT family N-acetyltransferase [Pedobacter vanadiisoli]|uniref:GNAT family N-acetyltransferase n=1 Tax=Pedobacter vanadiisoli TaxID=1761975 RepID=A0ABW5MI96_9SPHI
MKENYITQRLILSRLGLPDADFIFELLNSPEWIEFIGDRGITSRAAAEEYIKKITNDPACNFWVVKIKDLETPIGIITFIKRDYLDDYDIGFAFLNKYSKKGYAMEASAAFLMDQIKIDGRSNILAITTKANSDSIQLLEKLGMQFSKELDRENSSLLVYSLMVDKFLLNELTRQFFDVFTNANQREPDWERIYNICLPETLIIRKSNVSSDIYNLSSFIEPRKTMLSDGTLTGFEERETFAETKIIGNIAQRHSGYQKEGYINGVYFKGKGNKFFQFIRTEGCWKINSVIWEDE